MAFEGHHLGFPNSLFPTYQRQSSVNGGGSNNNGGMMLPFSVPGISLPEPDAVPPHMSWSNSAHDDPYGLINFVHGGAKNRKPTDNDCDGETDLQGLVSNIVDEECAESPDCYFNEGGLPTCNPIWSPKTFRQELLQYFQSEAKTQHTATFPPNSEICEALIKAQGQLLEKEEMFQQPTGPTTSQEWLFNMPNGDTGSYTPCPQKLPPGLPLFNTGNIYLSQVQQSKQDIRSADKHRGKSQLCDSFPDFSDIFRSQGEMSSPCFPPYYEDNCYNQSSAKSGGNEQCEPKEMNQLVSSFQSIMPGEHSSSYRGDFPNVHRQIAAVHHEDSMAEQWKINGPGAATVQPPKQPVGEFRCGQMERKRGIRNQMLKRDAFQDLPGFTECSQQSKAFPRSFNSMNQYKNKIPMHRGTPPLPVNQYLKLHNIQDGQIQDKIRPQMQMDKRWMEVSDFAGEVLSPRPQNSSTMRGGDKKQAVSHYPHFDQFGNLPSHGFNGENSLTRAGSAQQLMPPMYPVNEPRRHSIVPANSSSFRARAVLPHGSHGVPGVNMGNMMAPSESAVYSSYVGERKIQGGESTYHGTASPMAAGMPNQAGPVTQLYLYLDECYEQWRCLQKERKKTEVVLAKTFLEGWITAVSVNNPPKTPPNPTRVDHLIIKQFREEAKVASLLDRMECLYSIPLLINIHTVLNRHHMAICATQVRRKEEIANMSKHQWQRAQYPEDMDTLLLAMALKDLAASTRRLRTALWCALQLMLPKPVKRQEPQVDQGPERCPSPSEGQCFRL